MCIHTSLDERRLVTNVSRSRVRSPVHSEGHQPRLSPLRKGFAGRTKSCTAHPPDSDRDFAPLEAKTRRRSHDVGQGFNEGFNLILTHRMY